jgi:uncharacterized membrane protein YdjX (TVP38/TMEM64 family)
MTEYRSVPMFRILIFHCDNFTVDVDNILKLSVIFLQMWLTKYPKRAAVLRVAEQGSWLQQVRTIMLVRVSPFPYPLFNYCITATKIKYGPYIVGYMLGMVPEAFITIYR